MHIRSDDSSFGFEELTEALPNYLIFTNGRNLFIDQLLSKIQGKFEIN